MPIKPRRILNFPTFPTMISTTLPILFLISSTYAQLDEFDFDAYYRMVEENLEMTENYVLPTNNSRLATVVDDRTHDYGTFDFIVVGAGAAGTVVANRLSEIKKWKVLLLESGGEQTDYSNIPGLERTLVNSDMNWGYLSTPQQSACLAMINSSCISPRGRVLGGSTVLNAKMQVRGNRADFDEWARLGNKGWSYKEVLPYFKKSENSHIPNRDLIYHNTFGELDVSYFEDTFVTKIFLDGMQELGYNSVDYNGRRQIGASRTQSTLRYNRAVTGNTAFIEPVRNKRRNLNVTINALVDKVVIDTTTKSARGVEFIKNGHRYFARATKEVILSAGAINSPQILMLSGIGPKEHLTELGIPTIVDLPVGKNLHDHLMFLGFCIRTNQTIFNQSLAENLRQYLHNHRPYTAAGYLDGTAFVDTLKPDGTIPDIQFINSVMPGFNFTNGGFNLRQEAREEYLRNYSMYSDYLLLVVLLHPKSVGEVTLQSDSIVDFPNIDYRYLTAEEDVETLYRGVLLGLKLLETDAFRAVNASISNVAGYCGDLDASRKYWYCVIRNLMTTIYHPTGTTSMGTSPRGSVVDSKLQVHGIGNLRVADAGIMPVITSGNTQAPAYMIGEKASDYIKLRHLIKVLNPLEKLIG